MEDGFPLFLVLLRPARARLTRSAVRDLRLKSSKKEKPSPPFPLHLRFALTRGLSSPVPLPPRPSLALLSPLSPSFVPTSIASSSHPLHVHPTHLLAMLSSRGTRFENSVLLTKCAFYLNTGETRPGHRGDDDDEILVSPSSVLSPAWWNAARRGETRRFLRFTVAHRRRAHARTRGHDTGLGA